jgi:hypothetical protein
MKALDPFDLRCSICNQSITKEDLVAVVDHPFEKGQHMVVHTRHSGIGKIVQDPYQLVAGAKLMEIAWYVRAEISPEEALKCIMEEYPELEENDG